MRKTRNANPKRGHIHWKAPSRIFWKTVRGMIPHKTARGAAAMARLRTYEGIPSPYDQKKRMVVPEALKITQLKDNRKYCTLGEIAELGGWTKKDLVGRLEERRKEKSSKYYEVKQKKVNAKKNALKHKEVQALNSELAKYGF